MPESFGDPLGNAVEALKTLLETEIKILNGCLFDAAGRVSVGGDFDDGAAEWSIDAFAGEYDGHGGLDGHPQMNEMTIVEFYFTAPAQDLSAPYYTYSKMNEELLQVMQGNPVLSDGSVLKINSDVRRVGWRSDDNEIVYGLLYVPIEVKHLRVA